ILHGAVKRIRPKVMTVATILAGLVPVLWSHGTGADVMKRIAAPMVGGGVTSALLELAAYPALSMAWKGRPLADNQLCSRAAAVDPPPQARFAHLSDPASVRRQRCRRRKDSQLPSTVQPPSTVSACPLMKPLCDSSARKAIANEMSSGVANRA